MSNSDWARDHFKGDLQHDAVEVWALFDRPDSQGRTERLLRTTLICAIDELRKNSRKDMGPGIENATDTEFLVWDLVTDERKRKRWNIVGFEMRYARMVKN